MNLGVELWNIVCMVVEFQVGWSKTRTRPETPENLGLGRVGFGYNPIIGIVVIQPETQNTPIFGFGSGFGYFRVFAHSS